MRVRVVAMIAVAVLIGACGDGSGDSSAEPAAAAGPFGEGAFGYAASSNLAVGSERLLIVVTNDSGERLPSPDITVSVVAWLDGREFQQQTVPGSFLWAIPDVSGLYRANLEFDVPGTWYVGIVPPDGVPLSAFPVTVYDEAFTPVPGEPAPRSETLTLADAPLEELTTDVDPDPDLYGMSVAEAVTSGRPSVIVFATPRFCTTGICQPTMGLIRDLVPRHPGVNFVHVEVFTNLDDPENLEIAPGVEEWGIPTEPWVFVVDDQGIVAGRFEGLVTAEELDEILG